jgi:hypothetical protein
MKKKANVVMVGGGGGGNGNSIYVPRKTTEKKYSTWDYLASLLAWLVVLVFLAGSVWLLVYIIGIALKMSMG